MQTIRRGTLLFATLLAATACDSKSKEGEKAEEKADAAKPAEAAETKVADADAEKADAEKADADADADAKPEEKTEEQKKADRIARIKTEFEALDAWKAKEAERWNDEVTAATKELVAKSFDSAEAAVEAIVSSAHRHPDNVARDEYRHPKETLAFFGIEPDMTVVEVGPGRGWYTEILAPMLASKGKLVVTSPNPEGAEDDTSRIYGQRIATFLATSPDTYGKVEVLIPEDKDAFELGAEGSADMVLVIRGMHGWVNGDQLESRLKTVHATLKPGGVFGVVQHRAKEGADPKESSKDGYLPQPWLIEQIEAAGFELKDKSELNANPNDTTDHPEGVWTLPPSLALGDQDKAKYEGIGESDRMTLKFVKKEG